MANGTVETLPSSDTPTRCRVLRARAEDIAEHSRDVASTVDDLQDANSVVEWFVQDNMTLHRETANGIAEIRPGLANEWEFRVLLAFPSDPPQVAFRNRPAPALPGDVSPNMLQAVLSLWCLLNAGHQRGCPCSSISSRSSAMISSMSKGETSPARASARDRSTCERRSACRVFS
jgi:hypothetical protein